MRANKTNRRSNVQLITILSALVMTLHIAGMGFGKVQRGVSVTEEISQSTTQDSKSLDFHVWQVFTEDRKGFTTAVVSVNPRHFNRAEMIKLAVELSRKFNEIQKLKVGLLDDENIARLFATGRAEYSTYKTAERGRYYVDRTACREYIQFSPQRGKPRETIRIKCRSNER